MKVAQKTEAEADELSAIVDIGLGFPARGYYVGTVRRGKPIPATWSGNGEVPFGWTRHHDPVWVLSAEDAWFPLEDGTMSEIAGSRLLTVPQKSAIASAGVGRVVVTDPTANGTRLQKLPSAATEGVAAQKTAKDP